MKCKACNGKGYVYNALGSFNEDCGHCQGTGKVRAIGEPMTNEEWLRGLSFNELARVLYCMIINGDRIRPDLAYIKRWLKEKHNGV